MQPLGACGLSTWPFSDSWLHPEQSESSLALADYWSHPVLPDYWRHLVLGLAEPSPALADYWSHPVLL